MRKLTISVVCCILVLSCQKNTSSPEQPQASLQQILKRSCASQEVLEAQMAADPTLRDRMNQIEDFTQRKIAGGEALRVNNQVVIEIPVVVHVLYSNPEENISDAQIRSQIDVLNEDYNLKNQDNREVPALYSDRKANVGVKFVLAQTIRKPTDSKGWGANDAMKYTSKGGSDAVEPSRFLNMWSCNLTHNLLGYAQFPGGKPETDGVVILYSAFGRTGTLIQKYDKGRTATHEVGHWLNLRHIWGDSHCGNDLVDDTPLHTTANFGCPEYPYYNSCSDHAVEMTMNYMDYTDDACMFMFSNGQKARMLALFVTGGPRAAFVH